VTGDLTLTAQWLKLYTVTFKIDGTVDSSLTKTVEQDDNVTAPTGLTKEGYTLDGWYNGSDKYDFNSAVNSDLELTATWLQNYTVKFVDTNGETVETAQTVASGKTVTIPTLDEKTGYTFTGWTKDGTAYSDATITVTADVTLVANWSATTYSITYNGVEDATNPNAETTSYTIESDTITLQAPTKDGYTFAGWKVGSDTDVTETVTITKGSTGDKTFTATWTKNEEPTVTQYTVTFNSNDGSAIDGSPFTVTSGEKVTKPDDPTKEGYTFGGWYTDDTTFENAYDFDTAVTASITLYAKWTHTDSDHSYVLTDEQKQANCTADVTVQCTGCNETYTYPAGDGHHYDATDNNCSVCGASMKFYLAVSSNGKTVDASVFDDYAFTVTMPAADNSTVDASDLSITAKMQNVESLNVGDLRSHTITPTTGLTGTPDLSGWLKSCYAFQDGTMNVKVITTDNQTKECTYNFTGDNGRILGIPTDVDSTRAAWQAITANVNSTTQTQEDSYILLNGGSYIQIGTEKLMFHDGVSQLKIDNVSDFNTLNTTIRNALTLNTEAQDIDPQVYIQLTKGTTLAVGSSVATLDKDVTIGITGIKDMSTLNTALSTMRDSTGAYNTAMNLIHLFDALVAAVDGSDAVNVTIDFYTLNSISW
jgi:uncharacterized repeat protein (TIGR02543 family)